MSTKILILGGTTEARHLAHTIIRQRPELDVTLSLAGVTRTPTDMPCHVRTGSFGGTEGLTAYIQEQVIKAVIDATHPFAATMTQHAAQACRAAGVALLHFERPQWVLPPDTDVVFVPDFIEAARLIARTSSSAFLTIGRNNLSAFGGVRDVKLLVRLMDKADAQSDQVLGLENCTLVTGRPPFDLAHEEALMREHQVDTVVSKASGGDATRTKIDAAAKVGARIILIRRPVPPDGERTSSIEDALGWLYTHA